ncbi:MAG: hypothetical protein ACW990_00265 [Promethearchaeota archaeon]
MEVICYPKQMEKAKYKPDGAKWITLKVNPVSLQNLLDKHQLKTPETLLRKLWIEFKLSQKTFDRIQLKIRKR